MAKKITLTVNEYLFAQIGRWRSSFNLSRLFQDAVSEAIKAKEEFQRLLSGNPDIPRIVERLKAEKRGSLDKAAAEGQADGAAWAAGAHYDELVAAVGSEPVAVAAGAEAMAAWAGRRGLDGLSGAPRAEAEAAYRGGWKAGLQGFWDLVKEELGDE